MKTAIKRQNGTAKLKRAMLLSDNCQLGVLCLPTSIFPPFLIVIKGEWVTEAFSFHTAI